MDWLPVLLELRRYMPAIQRRGFSHLTLIDREDARRIAAQKIAGSHYALRSGVVPVDAQGWRFPLQHKDELDQPYEGNSMALTILVPWGTQITDETT